MFASTRALLQVYLLHHHIRGERFIPKWRKDSGKTQPRPRCARQGIRDVITQAPEAGVQTLTVPVPGSGEPFILTRRTEVREVESIWCFATSAHEGG